MDDLLVAKFPIFCERKRGQRPFYRAMIFRDVRVMRAFLYEQAERVELGKRKGYYDLALGCCTCWGNRSFVGTVSLSITHTGAGIVSHEMTHAAMFYLANRCRKFDPVNNPKHDERLAWTQGWLTSGFWRRFYALGLAEPGPG